MDGDGAFVGLNGDRARRQGDGVGVHDLPQVGFLAGRNSDYAGCYRQPRMHDSPHDIDIGFDYRPEEPRDIAEQAGDQVAGMSFGIDDLHAAADGDDQQAREHAKAQKQARVNARQKQPTQKQQDEKTERSVRRVWQSKPQFSLQ